MFKDNDAIATVAVKDLEAARKFYEEKLGLEKLDSNPQSNTYRCGNSKLMVYASEFAGTNKATSVTFTVGDEIEKIVRELRDKGVLFEHYDDLPETEREGDIHISNNVRFAWFKDADDNIFHLYGG